MDYTSPYRLNEVNWILIYKEIVKTIIVYETTEIQVKYNLPFREPAKSEEPGAPKAEGP